MFVWLETISPWWWVALALILGAIEMLTMSLFLLWPAAAALLMAVVVAVLPGMPGELRLAVFAALAIALTYAGRALVRRYGDGGGAGDSGLNSRAAQMVGRRGRLLSAQAGELSVEIDGVHWSARLDAEAPLAPGVLVEVTGVQGMTLLVRPRLDTSGAS
ncbi:NfeD family protein [Halovulum sp. GXIMD14794]